jgi:hypothetical protein
MGDSNVYSLSPSLSLSRLPYQGVCLAAAKNKLYVATECGDLHVFRLTPSLTRECVLVGLHKQPAVLARTFEGQSVTDVSYKHLEPESICAL